MKKLLLTMSLLLGTASFAAASSEDEQRVANNIMESARQNLGCIVTIIGDIYPLRLNSLPSSLHSFDLIISSPTATSVGVEYKLKQGNVQVGIDYFEATALLNKDQTAVISLRANTYKVSIKRVLQGNIANGEYVDVLGYTPATTVECSLKK